MGKGGGGGGGWGWGGCKGNVNFSAVLRHLLGDLLVGRTNHILQGTYNTQ